ncbi:hypothetical protein DFH11DRAFT_1502292 [Phellopilus nigrolimitatus]|nr:hypothetical protein DFH11DRAFT_1502292 [Phellopilus nigrolimitatus]
MSLVVTGAEDIAGPSTSRAPPLCALCNAQPSIYTCPRCLTKSCSLPCSRAHKAATGCSGERNRVAFVPMNQYGYGTLVDDYVFLEEVGRKVETWGREIVKGGIATQRENGAATRGTSMRGGRGRGRGKGRTFGHGQDKRNFLAMQLGFRDIDMDVLPPGMERAKRNQSSWDSKKKSALLTIEFVFQPPPNPLTRQESKPVSLVAHKNDWERSVRQAIRANVKNMQRVKKDDPLFQWLGLDEEDETIPSSVLCVMKRPKILDDSPNLNAGRHSYYKLDWNSKLSSALRWKHFVEFPTILLVDESSFEGVIVDDDGTTEDMRERRPKRRKLDPTVAKKTITGLLGDYGSDDEDDGPNILDTLDDYLGSDDDSREPGADEHDAEDGVEAGAEDQTEELRDVLDTAGDDGPGKGAVIEDEEEEDLDWGDDEIAEDEAKIASLSAAVPQRHSS